MPYLGRAPGVGNTVTGNLKVSGTISAESINDKLALNGSNNASPQANANDQILLEAGTLTDASHASVVPTMDASDNLLLEDVTPSFVGTQTILGENVTSLPFANINTGASTSGQFLTSGGVGVAPSFTTVSGADYGVKLQTVTASNDSTVAVTGFNNSTYTDYIIRFRSVIPATDGGVIFHMKTSTDGGSSYDAGSSDYSWHNHRAHHSGTGTAGGADTGDPNISITSASLGSDTAESLSGWVEILNAPDSTNYSHFQGLLVLADHNATSSTQFWFSGSRNAAADIDAVQFYFASGNVESGNFVLYGIK